MIYHVTCNTDDNYLQHCCAMLCSLFENNQEMRFHVHLLTHSLAADSKLFLNSLCQRYGHEISVYNVEESKLNGVKFRKNRPLTKAAYYRILLPEILHENIERVLYLDCDIIVLGSVKELYEIDLSEYALAACQDACPYISVLSIILPSGKIPPPYIMLFLCYVLTHNSKLSILTSRLKNSLLGQLWPPEASRLN